MPSHTLGTRLRELRLARGYSMRELTTRAKLKSVAFIADLERGFRFPSHEVLVNLASALTVPLDELRSYDRRAPLHEIAAMAEKDASWAAAFRAVVDAAASGQLTPKKLQKLVESDGPENPKQPVLNL